MTEITEIEFLLPHESIDTIFAAAMESPICFFVFRVNRHTKRLISG